MNDRYLFKAKRLDNGEWVQGNPIDAPDGRVAISTYDDLIEVKPATICQCTGLKDKNGRLIWEGDVVKRSAYHSGLDEILSGILIIKWDDNELGFGKVLKIISDVEEIEVIGNIFDNPELLEVQE